MLRIILSLITFIISSAVVLASGSRSSSTIDVLSVFIVFICSLTLYSKRQRGFSLYKIFHIYVLFFLAIAPSLQYKNNADMYGTTFNEYEYIVTFLYVILGVLVYNFVYLFVSVKVKKNSQRVDDERKVDNLDLKLIGISCFAYFVVLYMNNFSIVSTLVRFGDFVDRIDAGQIQSMLYQQFVRPLPMVVLLCAVILKRSFHVKFLLFAIFLLSESPFALSRFAVAAVYLPVMLVCLPKLRKGSNFVVLMVAGLLLVFPWLNNFKNFTEDTEFFFNLDYSQFQDVNFDSFSSITRVVRSNIVTNGYQLLGPIFFWVPRSIWSSKPIGSGDYVITIEQFDAENIAMSYFGEGYINFGIIGLVIFLAVLAIVTKKLDLWYKYSLEGVNNIDKILYFILVGLLLFILRGDLMSSTAYTCGFVSGFFFVKKMVLKL